jgi:hypothetical protein
VQITAYNFRLGLLRPEPFRLESRKSLLGRREADVLMSSPTPVYNNYPLTVRLGRSVSSYCNFSYSALACFKTGMSGSASFQNAKKS